MSGGFLIQLLVPVGLTALALLCAAALSFSRGAHLRNYEYGEIEGLRGLLAFFVFIHHAYVWRTWAFTSEWKIPEDHLFAHLGHSSVAMFFMITAFLFTGRMIDRSKVLYWAEFAIARFMRLMPAYSVAVLAVLALVAVRSGFELLAPPFSVARYSLQWFALGVLGTPDVNNVAHTGQMIAWVTWSLPFEVLFYLSLPIVGIAMGRRPGVAMVAACVIGMSFILLRGLDLRLLVAFLPGVFAALVVRNDRIRSLLRSPVTNFLFWASIVVGVWRSRSFLDPFAFLGMSGLFVSIACGNSLLGLLRTRGADLLGQISYSVYLLHGLVLYVVLGLLIGPDRLRAIDTLQYWLLIATLAPVVTLVAFATFQWVERPGIAAGRQLAAAFRDLQAKEVDGEESRISEPSS